MQETLTDPNTGEVLRRDIRPHDVTYKGETITVNLPGWYPEGDGDGVHQGTDFVESDRALHELKWRIDGTPKP